MRNAVWILLLAGCATGMPYPRWAVVGQQWGCDPLAVQAKSEEYRPVRPVSTEVQAQVGWDACEMLARIGEPREVARVSTEVGTAFHLTYMNPMVNDPHLVILRQDSASVWRVASVVW